MAIGFHKIDACRKGKRFCLGMVYVMSEEPEVFLSSKANAQAMVNILLINRFPTLAIPEHTESDRGGQFISNLG